MTICWSRRSPADPGALGVLGYSFLEENADKVAPVSLAGVAPTEATISDLSYPGRRKLYVYVKGEHIAAKPAIKQFIAAYAKAIGKGGMLEKRGLVPFGGADARRGHGAGRGADAARPFDASSKPNEGDERHDPDPRARRRPCDHRRRGLLCLSPGASGCACAAAARARLNSLPFYHASYAALVGRAPGLAVPRAVGAGPVEPGRPGGAGHPRGRRRCPTSTCSATPSWPKRATSPAARSSAGFNPESAALAPVFAEAERALSRRSAAGSRSCSRWPGRSSPCAGSGVDFRARSGVERWLMGLLVGASLIAILTTLGIVLSLLFESLRFFKMVSPTEFLFGTTWSPQTAIRADQAGSSGAFGSVPLFWGTIFIGAIIAMIVAIPLGLMSAIFLTQYAPPRLRAWLKPILEILAGVPTVVYGYFAALTVAPLVRDFGLAIGITSASSESALAAGLVMGIMIIPFVCSMADDSIAAVPQAMRDGSLALGATKSETIKQRRASRGAARRGRRRPARGQPRDRRDDDRRHGRGP